MKLRFLTVLILSGLVAFAVYALYKHRVLPSLPNDKRAAVPPPMASALTPPTAACRPLVQNVMAALAKRVSPLEQMADLERLKRCPGVPPFVTTALTVAVEACASPKPATSKPGPGRRPLTCGRAASRFDRALAEWSVMGVSFDKISDRSLLIKLLESRLARDARTARPVAERLLELDGQNLPAARALTFADFELAMGQRCPASQTDCGQWQHFDDSWTRVQALLGVNSPESRRLDAFFSLQRSGTTPEVMQKISGLTQSSPSDGFGPYLSAWAEARSGNLKGSVTQLREAIRREPKNLHYQGVLQGLTHPAKGVTLNGLFGSPSYFSFGGTN